MLLLAFVLAAAPVPRDAHGRILRHRGPVHAFMREHPCPGGPDAGSTVRCRGYKVDHVIPLCAGGEDDAANMQWQDRVAAAQKDRLEDALCRRGCRLGTEAR